MKKFSLALLLTFAVQSVVHAAPTEFSNTASNRQIKQEPAKQEEIKSFVTKHKALTKFLIAATIITVLAGGTIVAYETSDKFKELVDSVWASICNNNTCKKPATWITENKTASAIIGLTLVAIAMLSVDRLISKDASVFDAVVDAIYNQLADKKKAAPAKVETKIETPKVVTPVVTAPVVTPVTTPVVTAPVITKPVVSAPVTAPVVTPIVTPVAPAKVETPKVQTKVQKAKKRK